MTHSPEWEIARAARAAKRDNATDRIAAALTLFGLDGQASRHVADTAVDAIAGWLQEHGQTGAAALVLESHVNECTCGRAWSGHPNPHAITCPEHA